MDGKQSCCFHCGRFFRECVEDGSCNSCSYCLIIANMLKEEVTPRQERKEMELYDFFVFLFVVITIGLAIFVYNWSEEVSSLFEYLRAHIEGLFYSVCSQFTDGELLCKNGDLVVSHRIQIIVRLLVSTTI